MNMIYNMLLTATSCINWICSLFHLLPSQPRQYTFSDLLSVVQASEKELWDALEKHQACLIKGMHISHLLSEV